MLKLVDTIDAIVYDTQSLLKTAKVEKDLSSGTSKPNISSDISKQLNKIALTLRTHSTDVTVQELREFLNDNPR